MRIHRWVIGCLLLVSALGYSAFSLVAEDKKSDFLKPDQWEGLKYWNVEGTTVIGKTEVDPKHNTFLCSKKQYKNFEMKFEVQLKNGGGNSGIQIRSKVVDKAKFVVAGPQCDIGKGYWGSLYGERFGGMMKQADAKKINEKLKEKEFNTYYIKAVGKHVTIKVNDVVAVDDTFEKMPESGIIAFQLHQGGPMEVTFRNIEFTELPD